MRMKRRRRRRRKHKKRSSLPIRKKILEASLFPIVTWLGEICRHLKYGNKLRAQYGDKKIETPSNID